MPKHNLKLLTLAGVIGALCLPAVSGCAQSGSASATPQTFRANYTRKHTFAEMPAKDRAIELAFMRQAHDGQIPTPPAAASPDQK